MSSVPQTTDSMSTMLDGHLLNTLKDSRPIKKRTLSVSLETKMCVICGNEFRAKISKYRPTALTCGRQCRVTLGHQRSGPRIAKRGPNPLVSAHMKKTWAEKRQTIPQLLDKNWLEEHYFKKQLSQEEIGTLLGCSRNRVKTAMVLLNISFRPSHQRTPRAISKLSGEASYAWKGGMYNGRPWGINGGSYRRQVLRKQIIAARGHRCEHCGVTSKQLHVHHIVPFIYSRSNQDNNLLILCTMCHAQAERIFSHLAGKLFTSLGCPGLHEHVMTWTSGTFMNTSS